MKKVYQYLCTAFVFSVLVSPVFAEEILLEGDVPLASNVPIGTDAPLVTPPKDLEEEEKESSFSRRLSKDEVYSLSNKIESKKYATAGVEVITSQDIEDQGSPVITELLNSLTSVSIGRSGAGSMGSPTSFRIRGTDRVMVTLDGIRANSLADGDGKFYLQHYFSDDIERMEVVRGPQGTFQGAQASGGLVAMQTKQGRGSGTFSTNSEFGSFGLFKEHASYGMGDEKKDFYLGTTFLRTNGGAAFDDPNGSRANLDHDGYKNFSIVGNAGYRLMDGKAEIREIFRLVNAKKAMGGYYSMPPYSSHFDYNDYSKNLELASTTIFNLAPNDWYDSSTRFGLFHSKYNYYGLPDPDNPDGLDTDENAYNMGTRLNLLSQHNFSYKDWNKLSVGYNMEFNTFEGATYANPGWGMPIEHYGFGNDALQNDVFISDTINIKDILILKGGARMINHSIFGTYFTPNASAAIVLPTFKLDGSYSKLRGSWGQSVSMPTFYQMYAKLGGFMTQLPNPGLQPEHLDGWDAAFEQSFFNDKLSFEFGYFNNKYRDYIQGTYDPFTNTGNWANVASAKISGYEAGVKWQPNHIFKIAANYTFSDSENTRTGVELASVPKNRVNVGMYITPSERFTFFARTDATSDRVYDSNGNRINGFVDVSLGGRVKLFSWKKMHVFLSGTVYNLLNQNIELYRGYYQPGVHFRAGLAVEFRNLGEKL